MRLYEIKPIAIKAKTPEQARLDALKKQKDSANDALCAERDKQKIAKAQSQIKKVLYKHN